MWNCDTTPFIQVTWDGTEAPMRQTVRLAGAADDDPEDELELPEPAPEPQPAAASVTAAPSATAPSPAGLAKDLRGLTAGSPSPRGGRCRDRGDTAVAKKLIGNFPIR